MIKSGFRQLHFSNGNIGNIRQRKVSKNSTLFKNNEMVFLYPHSTPKNSTPCKKLEKRNGEVILCFYVARFISKTKAMNINKMAIYNKFFTH